jgi:hypothetical protein
MQQNRLCVKHKENTSLAFTNPNQCTMCIVLGHVTKLERTKTEQRVVVNKMQQDIYQLEADVERYKELFETAKKSLLNNGTCDCSDWDSCGTDPNTWEKLKRCNVCDQISVR